MIRIVVAVLLLLTAACSADPEPPRPAPTASPPPSGPGRFAGILDPCSLLTVEQVEQLVTLAEQKYGEKGGECTWSTPSGGLDGQAIYDLTVGVHLAADVAAAHAFFTEPPDSAFPGMIAAALPETPTDAQVGDESFVQVREYSHTTVLAFRLSNAVININYGRHAKPDPLHQDRARKAARWVAEALDRPAPAADPSDGRFAAAPYACSLLPGGVPESATRCGGLKVRHTRAWRNKSGITVAKEILAHYKSWAGEHARPVKGLGDAAFAETDEIRLTLWVRVSNLVLEIRFTKEDGKVTPEMREEVAEVLSRLPDH